MKKFNLTTRLNIKVVCIVSVFMIIITAHSQWVSLQEKKAKSASQLETITAFLVNKMPADSFTQIVERHGASQDTLENQVMIINKELQPILANVLIPDEAVKYGFYSRYHQRIVAIGPDNDHSLLVTVNPERFEDIYQTETTRLAQKDNSIVWYGAPILYHLRPISRQGQVIGHVFASINLNQIKAELWQRTVKTLLGGGIALLIVIMLFQEVFIRLKKDLHLFAEAILKGSAKHFESKIPELSPVLHYISEQTENMARLDRLNMIGEMAASIGHEVRNPMTTVRGFLQYLGNKAAFEDYKGQFALMINEMDRANSIITEFLSLAKNKIMNFENINLNQVITEVAPLIQVDALRHSCELKLELGTTPPVSLDANSMRQLILNLVRNAIEAMPQGGTIIISTIQEGPQVVLSIQDQGVGIPPEVLEKLGTPFFTTKEKGTGLGLAVCYRIVQRHEATISIKSELGQGTTFIIKFSCNKTAIKA